MSVTNGVDADRLRSLIARVERLEVEKSALAADIKDVYAEAKSAGYCVKTMRSVIKLRKIEADDRREQEELLDLYKFALGMLADLPLGEAAIEREASPRRKAVQRVQKARTETTDPFAAINARSKARLSESMAGAAALSNAAAAVGLISPESAAETERLTVAIANKLGAGAVHQVTPHDPETGEIEEPAPGCMAAPSPEDEALAAILDETRAYVMTDDEREAQARSFAYGNAALDNPLVTLEMVASAPYRVTDPAPAPVAPVEDAELPAFLDRRNWRDGKPVGVGAE